MAHYALAQHVFACISGEQLVLLDIKADRYWALELSRAAGLASLVSGWPESPLPDVAPSEEVEPADRSTEAQAIIDLLRSRGSLVEGPSRESEATRITAIPPVRVLVDEDPAGARAGGWTRFLIASILAKLALRAGSGSFERVVSRVRRRNERRRAQSGPWDRARARQLIEAFARYRVFLFSSKDECLYDSLALLEFLAPYGIFPDWVFGVQTRPFAAHCWVQQDEVVFNDTVEHVSGYTPIMVA